MTVRDLRDLLHERAGGPSPANPARHEQVLARVRRTRLRRRVTAGAAVAAAVVLGAAVVPGLTRPEAALPQTTVSVRPAPELPERFTAPDGTEYRRVAVTTIRPGGPPKTSVRVPVTGGRFDVAAVCAGGERVNVSPRAYVKGGRAAPAPWRCSPELMLAPLVVPSGAREVDVVFDTTTTGGGCVTDDDGTCRPVERVEGAWTLGVYAWTPPDRPAEPEPVRAMPDPLGGRPLIGTRTGVWPRDDTLRFTFEATGPTFGLDQICTGDLAQRLRFRFEVNGEEVPGSGCGVWKSGSFPMAMGEHRVRPGERVVVTARITVPGGHPNRPVRWSVGFFGS